MNHLDPSRLAAVRDFLEAHCTGPGRAKTINVILAALNMEWAEGRHPALRRCFGRRHIEYAIQAIGLNIDDIGLVTDSSGVWVATEPEHLCHEFRELGHRESVIREHKRCTIAKYERMCRAHAVEPGGQARIPGMVEAQ